jgi:hypothetical protein
VTYDAWITDSRVDFSRCKFTQQVSIECQTTSDFRECLFEYTSNVQVIATTNAFVELIMCKLTQTTNGAYMCMAKQNGTVYIDGGCVFDGIALVNQACGLYAINNGVIYFDGLWSTTMGNAQIRNLHIGVAALQGAHVGGKATNQYTNNDTSEWADAATFGSINN